MQSQHWKIVTALEHTLKTLSENELAKFFDLLI